MKKLLSVFIVATMLLSNVIVRAEDSVVLTVSDDTAIYENDASNSYKDIAELRMHSTGLSKFNKEVWLRFDLSNVDVKPGMRVKEATLSVYFVKTGTNNGAANGITQKGIIDVWSLTSDDYSEGVTWSTESRPTRNTKVASSYIPAKNDWKQPLWVDFDVTEYARLDEGDEIAFSLYPQQKDVGAYIASKEYQDGQYSSKLELTFEKDPASVMTILPSADASIDFDNPDATLGENEFLCNNALFEFDLFSTGDDDAKITDSEGYYGIDLTKYVSDHFLSDKKCRFYVEGTDFDVNSGESDANKPYLEIVFDGKKIHSAILYMYGVGRSITVKNADRFDESTVSKNTMPDIGSLISQGGNGAEFETTVEGYEKEKLNTTYYMALDPQNAYPKVSEVFDADKVPSASELKNMLSGHQHPYLIADYDKFEEIKTLKETDSYIKEWYKKIEASGDKFLTTNPTEYKIKGGALSSNVDDGAMTLAFLYRTTTDQTKRIQYAERSIVYLKKAVEYPDFNPSKMLNVGEMSRGVALAYDWLYDYEGFSASDKKAVEDTLVNKAINVVVDKKYSNHNNWNHVVNGGVLVAALAVGGVAGDSAAAAVRHTVTTLPIALKLYYPDGVFIEASGYYTYASSYLGPALASLESTLGTDFGLGDIKGLSQNGYYPIYTKGNSDKQAICYGDGEMAPVASPFLLYLAKRFNNTDYGMYQREADNNDIFSILWYTPESYVNARGLEELPEDYFADGVTQIISMRDGWGDENALFAGMKGGYNTMSHGDVDIGNFYIGAYGESFTKELLGYDYHGEGDDSDAPYFRLSRFTYYSKSPQGHNTIVINQPKYYPDMSFGQNLKAKGEYLETKSAEDESYAILDLTNVYTTEVHSAYRGIKLDKKNNRIIIADKINAKKPSDVWWFMHTDADIEVYGEAATLTINGKSLHVEIISGNAEFCVMDASPLPRTPTVKAFDSVAHLGEKKLAVRLRDVVDEELQICFSMLENDMSDFVPLLSWGSNTFGEAEIEAKYSTEALLTDDCTADERNGGALNVNGEFLKVMKASGYGYNYKSFLRFEPKLKEAEIDKVILTMHAVKTEPRNGIEMKDETVTLYPAKGEWNELTLTDKNAPGIITTAPIATATVPFNEGTKVLDEYITYDITEYFKTLTDKSEINLALLLTSRNGGCIYFDDKESGVAPKLEIFYKEPVDKTVSVMKENGNVKAYLCKKTDGVLEKVKLYDFADGKATIKPFDGINNLYVWDDKQKPVWFVIKE